MRHLLVSGSLPSNGSWLKCLSCYCCCHWILPSNGSIDLLMGGNVQGWHSQESFFLLFPVTSTFSYLASSFLKLWLPVGSQPLQLDFKLLESRTRWQSALCLQFDTEHMLCGFLENKWIWVCPVWCALAFIMWNNLVYILNFFMLKDSALLCYQGWPWPPELKQSSCLHCPSNWDKSYMPCSLTSVNSFMDGMK